jgi:hypothetical protein
MTDCPSAEMRDRLPDLLHERLDVSARAVVMAHVERCADCRAELTLLREARVALSSGVRAIDVTSIAHIVIARIASPALVRTPLHRARRPWMDWRVAASIAVLALGSASFAAIRTRQQQVAAPDSAKLARSTPEYVAPPVATIPEPRVSQPTGPATAVSAELSAAGGVGDLSDNDLRTLLDDLDSIDAMPSTEPEPVTVRVAPPGSGSLE